MNYSLRIPTKMYRPEMIAWCRDNVPNQEYMWHRNWPYILYYNQKSDIVAFKLRWGV